MGIYDGTEQIVFDEQPQHNIRVDKLPDGYRLRMSPETTDEFWMSLTDAQACEVARQIGVLERLVGANEQPQPTDDGRSYYDHPTIQGLQAIDVIQDFPYNIATAMAYLWRCGRKPGVDALEDLEKSRHHIAFEIERLKAQRQVE